MKMASTGDGYQRPASSRGALRLHLNEHTGGCSPRVLQRLRELDASAAALYPDYGAVTAAVANWLGVSGDEVVLTNGMDEGIFCTTILALRGRAAGEGIVVEPAFEVYDACVRALAGRVVAVLLPPDFQLGADMVARAVTPNTRLIFLNTPHNPSGACISRDAIAQISRAAPEALIFVDEAYVEFAADGATCVPEAVRSPNILVGRTFAKAHGLAGLRLGAVAGPAPVIRELKAIVPPYSINAYGAEALVTALSDRAHMDDYLAQVVESRSLIEGFCRRRRLHAFPSAANFVLIRFGDRANDLAAALEARGILVRNRSEQPNCEGCLRITAGVVEHTRRALDALEDLLCVER
jgi:histidinol-phosphate aminotransferase